MDAISRRYRKPKGRPSKRRSLCASKVQKRWGKNHMQSDFDSTVCAKNSDILLVSKCFEANKKLVEAFLKIGKGHAALELFSMAIGIHAMDKKTFSKCLLKLYEEKCSFKEDILEIFRKVVRKHHEDLLGIVNSGYNFGCFNSLAIEHKELSAVSVDISHKRDKRRLAQSEKKNSSDWKKKRISNKLTKSSKITRNIKKEGETYGSGKF
ncbi:uncharacterized protein TNIN_373921 [Trichonephila inaurata madagascariensis]|uniref:Uncharacterized protein n=1 Tax=Trichonephila inaurata madagascariensis TaxID=2747483 RepID=A0A8X6IRW7_9ARAC|nr:uncharacterized protein TNIN_373921 [Trichonephila inaurata madagascariensis]